MRHIEKTSHRIIFWSTLIIVGISSILLDFILALVMLFLSPMAVYLFTIITGLLFGFIFSFLILDLYHLEKKHHLFLSIYTPLIALLNIYLVLDIVVRVSSILGVFIESSPSIVAFLMLFGYSLPYLVFGMGVFFRNK
jgi:hypothetical protein